MKRRETRETYTKIPTLVRSGEDSLLAELTDNFRWQGQFPDPANIEALKKDLVGDLKSVPVVSEDGNATNVFEKIENEDHMSRADKDLVWSCLAMVR